MTVTFNIFLSTWSPRTGVHKAKESEEKKSAKQGTIDDWIYTRGLMLRVLGRFPDAVAAIREALEAAHRAAPQELYEPG